MVVMPSSTKIDFPPSLVIVRKVITGEGIIEGRKADR